MTTEHPAAVAATLGNLAGTLPSRMLLGGAWVPALSGETFETFDPATGTAIGRIPLGGKADIDRAVDAARQAFDNRIWTDIRPADRAKILWRAADLIDRDAERLGTLETLDNGMPLALAQLCVARGAEAIRYYAGWCTKLHGITSEISAPGEFHAYTLKEPVGVVGLIVPWNSPFLFACCKLAPALAAGCTCILKPAEETPLTALALGELLVEAGIPDGVVNIVTGYGETAGAALVANAKVDKISFTGSTEIGKAIVQAAAGNLKRVTLELGGKSPVLVFEDADLDEAIAGVATGIFLNSGQVCVAGSRAYIHRSIYQDVVGGVSEIARSMKLGSGFDSASQLGPLISAKQLDRVSALVDSGRSDGGDVLTGGRPIGSAGYFYPPTVVAGLDPGARMIREEIFGPVLAASAFDDVEDLVCCANATAYGLAAQIWTQDIKQAHAVAKRLQAGTVWINCALVSDFSMPFGGYKQSGWGREYGLEGLEAFLETKSIFAKL